MIIDVVDVEVAGPFRLRVLFSNGSEGVYDMSYVRDLTGPVVEPLHDPEEFARAFVDYGAVTWPSGFDICPDSLYARMRDAGAFKSREAAE